MKQNVFLAIGIVIVIASFEAVFKLYTQNSKQVLKHIKSIKISSKEILTPNTGKQVLPIETQILLFAIDTLNIDTYRTHGNFSKTGNKDMAWFYLNGTAWPAHLDSTSNYVLGLTDEISTISGIKIIFNYQNVGVGVIN